MEQTAVVVDEEGEAYAGEYTILVEWKLSDEGFGAEDERMDLWDLEDQLIEEVDQQAIGAIDDTETGLRYQTVYIYSHDPKKVIDTIKLMLEEIGPRPGSYIHWYLKDWENEQRLDLAATDA